MWGKGKGGEREVGECKKDKNKQQKKQMERDLLWLATLPQSMISWSIVVGT